MALEGTDVRVARTEVLVHKFLINEEDDQRLLDDVMRRIVYSNIKIREESFS